MAGGVNRRVQEGPLLKTLICGRVISRVRRYYIGGVKYLVGVGFWGEWKKPLFTVVVVGGGLCGSISAHGPLRYGLKLKIARED